MSLIEILTKLILAGKGVFDRLYYTAADNNQNSILIPDSKRVLRDPVLNAKKVIYEYKSCSRELDEIGRRIELYFQDIENMLKDPDQHLKDAHNDNVMAKIPVLSRHAKRSLIKDDLKGRLDLIKDLLGKYEEIFSDKERVLGEAINDIIGQDINLFSGLYSDHVGDSHNNLVLQNEAYQEYLGQRQDIAFLLTNLNTIRKEMPGKKKDLVRVTGAHRLRLEKLVDRISETYNVQVKGGAYHLSAPKKSRNLAFAMLAAATIAGCAIAYNSKFKEQFNPLIESSGQKIGIVQLKQLGEQTKAEESSSSAYALPGQLAPRYGIKEEVTPCKEGSKPKEKELQELVEESLSVPEEVRRMEFKVGQHVVYINKKTQKLNVYIPLWVNLADYTISTGRNPGDKKREGDGTTPETKETPFRIVSIMDSSGWDYSGADGFVRNAYGQWFMRLNCGSWDSSGNHDPEGKCPIGIHGTAKIWEKYLGTAVSHGCIRVLNSDLIELSKLVKVGTPVIIKGDGYSQSYAPKDDKLSDPKISEASAITTGGNNAAVKTR